MDPALDPMAASAPFPTIPAEAPTPRPRVAKPRRQAAPFLSDHPVASSSPGRRTGGEFSSFASGAGDPGSRPSTAGAAPAAFVFGGDAASSRGAEENPPSVSSWSCTRDAEFVFGSGVSGTPEVTRSLPLGSGDASLSRLSAAVGEFSLGDSSCKQSDDNANVLRGNDSVLEMNIGAHRSLNLHEHFCPMIFPAEAEQLNEACGIPSQTTGCESVETSSLAARVVNATMCTEKNVPMESAKDGGNSSVGYSVDKGDSAKDESKFSANAGVAGPNFFVFGEHTSVGHRRFVASTVQNDIKKVDSSNKENVSYSFEDLDPSTSEGSACTKVQPACDSSNRDPPHLAPYKISETEKASNDAPFKFESQNDNINVSFTKLSDGMETESTLLATSVLGECGSFDEKSFTVHDHNAASREKVGVKGMNMNRRAVKQKKLPSARQISSLQTVFTGDRFAGIMTPEINLHLREIVNLPTSTIGLAQSEVSSSEPSTALAAQCTEYTEPKTSTVSRGLTCTETENFGSQEDCEAWRLRGNHAYDEGQLAKAEECYTYGINSVSLNEASPKALMLCYSNRAATRMSLGRMREALSDCQKAIDIDSNFLKAQVRASNCLLALGDVKEAKKGFETCLKSNHLAILEHKIVEEASDGLQKAQKVFSFMLQSKEYLVKKAFDKMPSALQMISDALSISIYSDNLMAMKAEALLLLHRYEEVIRFCEETLHLAERNSVSVCPHEHSKNMNLDNYSCSVKLWRYYLIAKSYFFIGKLEEAHHFLKKHEQAALVEYRCGQQYQQSVSSFTMAISELLRLKAAGNEAFHAGKYSEAVDHYTAALLNNTESLHFSAICFGNRAAAYQAMDQILDAIADCSLAIALDTSYSKAISRRASLYELIRDCDQAGNDLRRLISLLEKQLQENMSMPSEKSDSIHNNLNRAYLRLSTLERDSRKGTSLNIYLILGIEPSCSAMDIKKAYRKAALRHHPDKAGNFLARSENISDASWREITNEIRRDADYLFKIIGKAYAILSDPIKKSN